ncbi:Tumor susceptibility protein 101 protein [Sphaceloma murrayae]|uniref:Tumor susceptibility protein 101 protein n=1 Tax=Sphaceloma murrayae TaxID=2082308 RepID=A0A2K1QMN6_9PEZI|nr:Tumor susceptibility protein 101 protein [Sphaceloma murrayae]
MAQVPDSTLVWLWDQLQSYGQARLAYNDIAAAIANYPSLQPRTDTYHFENGRPALLVCLAGTIAVDFRGRQYRYPVEIWIPQEYGQPGVGIIAYVRPSTTRESSVGMMVRPGQHVAVDGRIYHPYLRDWGLQSRCTIVDFLRILQGVFAKEPPIVATNQSRSSTVAAADSVPAVPPKPRPTEPSIAPNSPNVVGAHPPPLPSKPGRAHQGSMQAQSSRAQSGPPLPPLPPEAHSHQRHSSASSVHGSPISQSRPHMNGAPPLPSKQNRHPSQQYMVDNQQYQTNNRVSSPVSPISPTHRADTSTHRYDRPAPLPAQNPVTSSLSQQYQMPNQAHTQGVSYQHHMFNTQGHPLTAAPPFPGQGHSQQERMQFSPRQQIYAQAQNPAANNVVATQDLLTDPFDISLAPALQAGPPPPIPPNPEKEHLLAMLSQMLVAQATSKISQSQSAIEPLTAQRQALLSAYSSLQAEIQQLQSLDRVLTTNENILHQSIRDCNSVLESSKKMPQPNIDEVLVAPTVAAQQLWNLCAEEAGIKEALWCLQRAVGAGRISGTEFD